MHDRERFRGCLLGLAVGDAVGTAVEFRARGTFTLLSDMVGGGPFALQPGEWTDDTSMALCLGTSLIEQDGFDPGDQMDRYCRWHETGYMSSTGVCFDIGNTVASALRRYRLNGDPLAGSSDPSSAGNGCIMRLAPVAMFYANDIDRLEHFAAESSKTTHRAAECVDACRLLGRILGRALHGMRKDNVLLDDGSTFVGAELIEAIARGTYRTKELDDIRGSGYVVQSLEAALWCFDQTETFEDAILAAANLGHDADTTAAVCGQVAGAFYGESEIPPRWLKILARHDEIAELADDLWEKSRGE